MDAYNKAQVFQVSLAGEKLLFISKPGLPAWDIVSPSTRLLAEEINPSPSDRGLFLGCGQGAAAVPIARQLAMGELWIHDPSVIALYCAEQTMLANQVQNVKLSAAISLLPTQAALFDLVLIDLPKGRNLARRWLVEAYMLLKIGGNAYLAGSNEMGIQSLIKDAHQLFGNSGILGYKKGARLARLVKTSDQISNRPGWAIEPGIAPGTWSTYPIEFKSETYQVHALPGVFSQTHLDEGTRLLLQHAPPPQGTRVLDIGCGVGVIGMVIARRLQRQGLLPAITMIDSNLMAVASAEQNILVNQIPGTRVLASDLIPALIGETYDLILSNPPFHAGNETNYAITAALIAQSHRALAPGGVFVLVANRFLRYNLNIEKVFSNVRWIYQDGRYHILAGTK